MVVAASPWANRLLAALGLDLGLVPVRAQVVVFRLRAEIDATRHSWLRTGGTAFALIGAERALLDGDPDRLDETVDAACIAPTRAALAARFLAFAAATMRGGWIGTFMRSPDGHPVIDSVPSVGGTFCIAGDSRTFFRASPAIGVCLAEWIVDGAPRLVDLSPFRPTRFSDGQPWTNEHACGDDRRLRVSR